MTQILLQHLCLHLYLQHATALRASMWHCCLKALKARVMWQWMCGEHPNKVLPILVAGGSISVSKSKQSPKRNVKGVLRILNPVGSIRQEWEHGCDVCDSLALTPLEKKALLTAILNIRYVHARYVMYHVLLLLAFICYDVLLKQHIVMILPPPQS